MTAGRSSAQSLSKDWCTPPKYAEAIRGFFGGTVALDPCSNRYSIIGASREYLLPAVDVLSASWNFPTIFVNPPYGRDKQRNTSIRDWFRKCFEANRQHHAEVLALVPVATNTRHWKGYVFGAATAVAFLYDTRLRFLEHGNDPGRGAPMSCAMVYWGARYDRFEATFIRFGAVADLRHLLGRPIGMHGLSLLDSSSSDQAK